MSKEADLYNNYGKSLINYNGANPASKEKDPLTDLMEFKSLEELNFESRFFQKLTVDPETTNVCRQVLQSCASKVQPTPVADPKIIAWSREVAAAVGFPADPNDWPEGCMKSPIRCD